MKNSVEQIELILNSRIADLNQKRNYYCCNDVGNNPLAIEREAMRVTKNYLSTIYKYTYEISLYLEILEEIRELREEYKLELNMLKDNVSHLFIRVDELIEKRLHTRFSHSTSEMHNLTYLWEREVDMDIQNFLRNISK